MNVGRNDPCPCGSGKKYKRCCLGHSVEETQRSRKLTLAIMAVIVVAVIVGLTVSDQAGWLTGAVGLVATGIWQWLTVPPPKSGSGSDPGAINFGR